jgi:hypothetical protein
MGKLPDAYMRSGALSMQAFGKKSKLQHQHLSSRVTGKSACQGKSFHAMPKILALVMKWWKSIDIVNQLF